MNKPTLKQIAEHLSMSVPNYCQIRKHIQFPDSPTLDEVRCVYIKHLRGIAGGTGVTAENKKTLSQLKVELEKQKLLKLEMANQRYKGELLDANEVEQHWNSTLMAFRSRILAIPSTLSPAIAACKEFGEIKETLTIAMNDTLQNLADFDKDNYEYKNTTTDTEETDNTDTRTT